MKPWKHYGAGIHDPDLARIPHRHMKYLEELGLPMENIQVHGGNFVNVEVGFAETSFGDILVSD